MEAFYRAQELSDFTALRTWLEKDMEEGRRKEALDASLARDIPCNAGAVKQVGPTCYMEAASNIIRRSDLRHVVRKRVSEIHDLDEDFRTYMTQILENEHAASCPAQPQNLTNFRKRFDSQTGQTGRGGNTIAWLIFILHALKLSLNIDISLNIEYMPMVEILNKMNIMASNSNPDIFIVPDPARNPDIIRDPNPRIGYSYLGSLISMEWTKSGGEKAHHAAAIIKCVQKEENTLEHHINTHVSRDFYGNRMFLDGGDAIVDLLDENENKTHMSLAIDFEDDKYDEKIRVDVYDESKRETIHEEVYLKGDLHIMDEWLQTNNLHLKPILTYNKIVCDSNYNTCERPEEYKKRKGVKSDFRIIQQTDIFMKRDLFNGLYDDTT